MAHKIEKIEKLGLNIEPEKVLSHIEIENYINKNSFKVRERKKKSKSKEKINKDDL